MEAILYRFKSISVEQFALLGDCFFFDDSVEIKTGFLFRFVKEECSLISVCDVEIFQKGELKIKATLDCSFEINKKSVEDCTKEDGSIIMPKHALIQFASLNYGTLRGVIVEKTKGTTFASAILPPLVVAELITEDLCVCSQKE